MTDPELDALAASIGVVLQPEWRAGVRANYDICMRVAALVAEVPLDDDTAAAAIFQA